MYSQYLQDYINELSDFAEVDSSTVEILRDSMGLFVQILAKRLGGANAPATNLLDSSLQLLVISHALSNIGFERRIDGGHYLVAVGFEQAGKLFARSQNVNLFETTLPLDNDHWYRLVLAFLHYLAGGHRIQAKAILNYFETSTIEIRIANPDSLYLSAINALKNLYEGRPPITLFGLTSIDLQLEDDMEAILSDTRANGGATDGRWSPPESRQTDPSGNCSTIGSQSGYGK
jgi:hypothetical protein